MSSDDLAELKEKAAFFARLSSNLDDDALDPREAADRELRRRLFRAAPSSTRGENTDKPSSSSAASSSHDARSRASSGRSQHIVIKGTPAGSNMRRGRVTSLLNAGTNDENVVPDSTRPATKLLQRSNSTPLPQLKRMNSNSNSTSLLARPESSPSAAAAAAATNMAGSRKKQKKRHSSDALKLRSEDQQIFRGLSFFYIPDNDIAPVRRMRINKAREYGAEWTRNVNTASHVVIEKALDWKSVQGFLLGRGTGRKAAVTVVNEDWPIDCVQFGSLLDCEQAKYRITGQPNEERFKGKDVRQSFEDEVENESLPLKAPPTDPTRWDYVPPPGTPTRSAESSLTGQNVSSNNGSQSLVGAEAVVASPRATAQTNAHNEPAGAAGAAKTGPVPPDGAQHKDELSDMISVVTEYKDLPVDPDEDDDNADQTAQSDGELASGGSDAEETRRKPVKNSTRRTVSTAKNLRFEERFACNSAGAKDAKSDNPNARTIEVLQKMANYYCHTNDHWRTTSYRKAISTLKRQTKRIETEEEAFQLPSVGRRLAQKIAEIVTTDRLERLEYAQKEPMAESLKLFLGVYGVGNNLAQQWISQGYRTLDDLVKKAKLTPNQKLGVEHYADLNSRIPRREMDELGKVVKTMARRIDPEVELIIGGSYRRHAESSGDIDFIITKRDTTTTSNLMPFLQDLVRRLEESGFLVARLASSRSEMDGSKWHGCCVLPFTPGFHTETAEDNKMANSNYRPIWRRIDFLVVPETERGAALLYFTGNDIFNRSMRLLASRKGMRLNQRGLYKDVLRGPGRQKMSEGELVEGRDERRIFEELGVRWREPHERWC